MSSDELFDYSQSQAILIGTSRYADSFFPPLPAVANSVRGMRETLTDPALCGWPAERVIAWEDPTDVRPLVRDLRRLARQTLDVLLVYFVGHGTITPRGQLCMILADTDADNADITGLEFERLRQAVLDSPARTKIVILDCCYSGRAIEVLSGTQLVADSTDTRGVYTLTASDHTAHVVALDRQADAATSFTGEFLDLIHTGVPGGPERLTLSDLYLHLRRRLRARGLPAPNQRGTDTADRYLFTHNAAIASQPQLRRAPIRSPERGDQTGPLSGRRRIRRRTLLAAGLVAAAVPAGDSAKSGDLRPGMVASMAFSGDGKIVAGGGFDETVRLWNVATGRLISTLSTRKTRFAASIESLAFSPDGKALAAPAVFEGYRDHGAVLWDVASARITRTFPARERARVVAFSPDGMTLAGGDIGNSDQPYGIVLWDAATGRTLKTLAGHTGSVNSVAFSPDGKTLASGGWDKTVRLWNLATGRSTTLTGHQNPIVSVAFTRDGKTLASGARNEIWFWDLRTARTGGQNLLGIDTGGSVAFDSTGKIIAADSGGKVQLWNAAFQPLYSLDPFWERYEGSILEVAFSPDGRTLAGAGAVVGLPVNVIWLWDTATTRDIRTLIAPTYD
jgi:hypothetical protein